MTRRDLTRTFTFGTTMLVLVLLGAGCLEKKSSLPYSPESTPTLPELALDRANSSGGTNVRAMTVPNDGTPCGAATANALTTVALFLDEADRLGPSMSDAGLEDRGNNMGQSIGLACDEAGVTQAFSQIIVYLDSEQGNRLGFTEEVIGGLLSSLCGAGLTLTLAAQQACSTNP